MELFEASKQCSTRPPDQRFWTLKDLSDQTLAYRKTAAEASVPLAELRVEAQQEEILLCGTRTTHKARLTHWAMGQLCQDLGAPAGYLRGLSPTLAAQNLNYGLAHLAASESARLLFHRNGDLLLRAITSERYTRIWNCDIATSLLALTEGTGWRVPPARPSFPGQPGTRKATAEDVLTGDSSGMGLSVQVGDPIAPAGLYASDHDLFVFMVDPSIRIAEPGNQDGLARGFFCWNSEVGASTFGVTKFMYRSVCGNHIVWGASGVSEIRLRHLGRADERAFWNLGQEVARYAQESAAEDEARIRAARRFRLEDDKETVINVLHNMQVAPRKQLTAAYELAEANSDLDGSPRSAWGMAQGLTRLSQTSAYTDQRVALDRAAGKILQMAF